MSAAGTRRLSLPLHRSRERPCKFEVRLNAPLCAARSSAANESRQTATPARPEDRRRHPSPGAGARSSADWNNTSRRGAPGVNRSTSATNAAVTRPLTHHLHAPAPLPQLQAEGLSLGFRPCRFRCIFNLVADSNECKGLPRPDEDTEVSGLSCETDPSEREVP